MMLYTTAQVIKQKKVRWIYVLWSGNKQQKKLQKCTA